MLTNDYYDCNAIQYIAGSWTKQFFLPSVLNIYIKDGIIRYQKNSIDYF